MSGGRSFDEVLRGHPLMWDPRPLFPEARVEVPDWLRDNVRFALDHRAPGESGAFYAENFVAPLLTLAWRSHPRLHVWSHRPLLVGNHVAGVPDYLVTAAVVSVSRRLMGTPLAAVAVAERENFDEGWGQCLVAMLACQAANGAPRQVIYGIVSTGLFWEFGRLDGQRFARHPDAYAIHDAALVNGMIGQVFAACEAQLP